MDLVKVKGALQYARSQVEKGWCQGMLGNYEGEMCAKGALHKGVAKELLTLAGKEYWAVYSTAHDYLLHDVEIKVIEGYDPLVEWNDVHGRTQKEVLELFDKAIGMVEEKALQPTYFAWMN